MTTIVTQRTHDYPSDSNAVAFLVKRHQSLTYIKNARLLIKPLIKDPIEKWSSLSSNDAEECVELGNGVWLGIGKVETKSISGVTSVQSWKVYFDLDSAIPLYRKVGDLESGDLQKTLALAQSKTTLDKKPR